MMPRRRLPLLCALLLTLLAVHAPHAASHAQDGLDLPTALYVLRNEGRVQRYGLGAEGVRDVTPEGVFVVDFGVAPDGTWLAYRTPEGLTVFAPTTGERALVDAAAGLPTVRGDGATVAWAPDASAIAYTTQDGLRVLVREGGPAFITTADAPFARLVWSADGVHLAAGTSEDLWWVYRRDGLALVLVAVLPARGATFVDAVQLAITPQEGGLVLMDLARANAQRALITPDRWRCAHPTTLNDGSVGALCAATDAATATPPPSPTQDADTTDMPDVAAPALGEVGQWVVVDAEAGALEVRGRVNVPLEGLAWGPGGQVLARSDGRGGLSILEPRDGASFTLPLRDAVSWAWGAPPLSAITGLVSGHDSAFIAEVDGVAQVWRLPGDGGAPRVVSRAQADVRAFAFAPGRAAGGARLAFTTADALFVQDGSSPPVERATLTGGDASTPLAWNADGTLLAYADGGLWLADADAPGEARLLVADTPDRALRAPRFAPNFAALLVDVVYPEGRTTGVLDLNTGELQEMPFGHLNGLWLTDGRVLTYAPVGANVTSGLQLAAVNALAAPVAILPPPVSVRAVTPMPDGLVRLVIGAASDPAPVRVRAVDLRPEVLLQIPAGGGGFMQQPVLSPGGAFVAGVVRPARGLDGSLGGTLAFTDLGAGTTVALADPAPVIQFVWLGPAR